MVLVGHVNVVVCCLNVRKLALLWAACHGAGGAPISDYSEIDAETALNLPGQRFVTEIFAAICAMV